jgi:hypothetical protein
MLRPIRLITIAGILLTVHCCPAANFSFTGSFAFDTDVQLFTFTLLQPTAGVALRTWSYSGGTNAESDVITSGGFEPILNLYEPDGTQMNPGVGGPCTVPTTGNGLSDLLPDPVTGECADVYYPTTLSFPGGVWDPGTYTIALTQNGNPGIGNLSDGFFAPAVLGISVPGNFTCQTGPTGFQGEPPTFPVDSPFCDQFDPAAQRSGDWALDILNVDSANNDTAAAPEPGALPLFLLLAVAAVPVWRRPKKRVHAALEPCEPA